MENNDSIKLQSNSKRSHIEVDLANLPTDPFLRKKIYDYHHPSDRDNIRRAYLQKKNIYLEKHGVVSILQDAAYCLFCYLFRLDIENQNC
jgi:hypothetical protein